LDLTKLFIGFIEILKFDFEKFVLIYNDFSPIYTWFVFLLFCFISILIFLKLFGEIGLYVYSVIAIIAANIQVLKLVEFSFFSEPIALGTALFASTFLCTDILAEYYSPKKARINILIGFSGFLFMTILMLFTLGFKPLNSLTAGENYAWALNIQDSLLNIFLPFPTFFAASMIAFLISQFFDVWFFDWISDLCNKRFLWFRNNVSTICSSLIDNFIFSIFAWIIFNPNPLDFYNVIFTFVLGTYILRVVIAVIDTPFIYLSKYFIPKKYE
tara:strand:+ start:2528 stop:3340 length:813 start_codon:yes stop_codon:yes gene_type:complete